jgi:hypothetical protein
MDERVLVRFQLRPITQLLELIMAILATTDLLQLRPETPMGPDLNLLHRHEPDPHRCNPLVHRPCSIRLFPHRQRLRTVQLQGFSVQCQKRHRLHT